MKSSPKPTLRSIAEATGFSQATISRVLANRMEVPEETRSAIHAAAKRLGYRGVRAHHGSRLGLLWSPTTVGTMGPFFSLILESLLTQGDREGFGVDLVSRDRLRQRAEDPFGMLRAQGVDLLVTMAGDWRERFMEPLIARRFPVVCVNHAPAKGDPGDIPYLYSDPFPATQKALRHLREVGHRKVHWFGDSQFINETQRRDAMVSAGKMLGFGPNQLPSVQTVGDDTVQSEKVFHELWHREKPTAVIAVKLRQAIGVLSACRSLKLRIPRDMSILTHDDYWLMDHMSPTLTTLGQDNEGIGNGIIRLARDLPLWSGGIRPIPTLFTLRESVGPPRKNAESR